MSRVPVWWSMMPTTMNSAALNSGVREQHDACPAVVASGVPAPNRTMRKPSWLTVP